MTYKIDPTVLAEESAGVLDLPLETGERFAALIERLAAVYPGIIENRPPRWMMSKAGGILGKISFLYMNATEYLLIFGSPAATNGFTGRYNHVDIHKVVLAGRYVTYDLESDQIAPTSLLPGDSSHLGRGQARGLQIDSGSWHLEYGRGLTMTAMPFAMMDTLVNSMALKPVLSTTSEYLKFTGRDLGRRFKRK
jgi:sigma non-opioid intracellular receptor